MATTTYHGIRGSVASGAGSGTKIGNVKSWDLTIDIPIDDTTALGDADATGIQGARTAKAKISGDLSTDATQNTIYDQGSNSGTLSDLTISLFISTVAGKKAKWYGTAARITKIGTSAKVGSVDQFDWEVFFNAGVKYSTT